MSASTVGLLMAMCAVAGGLIGAAVTGIILDAKHARLEPDGRHAALVGLSTYQQNDPATRWPVPLSPRLTDPRPAAPPVELEVFDDPTALVDELPVQRGTRAEHQRHLEELEAAARRDTTLGQLEELHDAGDAFLRVAVSTAAAQALSVVDAVARPLGVGRFRQAPPAPDPERELVSWLAATGQLPHLTTESQRWAA